MIANGFYNEVGILKSKCIEAVWLSFYLQQFPERCKEHNIFKVNILFGFKGRKIEALIQNEKYMCDELIPETILKGTSDEISFKCMKEIIAVFPVNQPGYYQNNAPSAGQDDYQ